MKSMTTEDPEPTAEADQEFLGLLDRARSADADALEEVVERFLRARPGPGPPEHDA